MTEKQIIAKYLPKKIGYAIEENLILFEVSLAELATVCAGLYKMHELPLKTAFATDERKEDGSFKIFYVFGIPHEKYFLVPFIKLQNTTEFPSLVSVIHELSWYEREIHTFFGLKPEGHPQQQRIILHDNWPVDTFPLRKDFPWNKRPAVVSSQQYHFEVVKGEGIYELPVGPIHAGIIEPGHFRFSLAGEEIVALEPQLGYVHKGIEKLFENLPQEETVKLSERVSGDTSYGHSLAFCQAMEVLSNKQVPQRAKYLRVVYAELERLANHFNDIGFIMMDTAFTFGGSQGTRLKEVIMQINQRLTGSRFLRGVNVIGGVTADISIQQKEALLTDLYIITKDFTQVIEVANDSTSMINRLQGAGVLAKQIGIDHGIIGVPARAMGLAKDARVDYPYAAYAALKVPVALEHTSDVLARFNVRVEETYTSLRIIKEALEKLPEGSIVSAQKTTIKKNSKAIGIVEGWRGDIVYVVVSDNQGKIARVVARDPSYLNWSVVPYAVVGNPVPEFPLINKSFNLSYSGDDK